MFKVNPNTLCKDVMIIGCGGTGSRLVNLISQFLNTMPFLAQTGLSITLVDDDEVEQKNLARQNFTSRDIGKNKAMVLAQRYSKSYEVSISAIAERVGYDSHTNKDSAFNKQLDEYLKGTTPLIIMCVDSPLARRAILYNLIMKGITTGLLIDTGNENDFGQVKIMNLGMFPVIESSRGVSALNELVAVEKDRSQMQVPDTILMPQIPLDLHYFSSMEAKTTASCADLDQTMAINNLMAGYAMAYVQNWVYAKPIHAHTFNIDLTHGATPQYMNAMYLEHLKNTAMAAADSIVEEATKGEKKRQGHIISDRLLKLPLDVPLIEAKNIRDKFLESIKPPPEPEKVEVKVEGEKSGDVKKKATRRKKEAAEVFTPAEGVVDPIVRAA